jgi:hypothetical protein
VIKGLVSYRAIQLWPSVFSRVLAEVVENEAHKEGRPNRVFRRRDDLLNVAPPVMPPVAEAGTRATMGVGIEPEPVPVPRDSDTLEMFETEEPPAPPPELTPSPNEGADCAGGDAWDGDPSRVAIGLVAT